MNAHLDIYLIWWRDSTAKDAKMKTPPNIHQVLSLREYMYQKKCCIDNLKQMLKKDFKDREIG